MTTFLEYLAHLKNLVLDDEDDEKPGDYSSETKGTLRIFAKIKKDLLERLKFMKNIFSFLTDEKENFILIETVDLENIGDADLERMEVGQADFEDLERIHRIVGNLRQSNVREGRGEGH